MEKEEESRLHTPKKSKTNGVKITVYVESSTMRSGNQNKDGLKRFRPNPLSKRSQDVCRSSGYCRRTQLLAYARELRESHKKDQNQEPSLESNSAYLHSKPKKLRWSVSSSISLQGPLFRLRQKKLGKYQAVTSAGKRSGRKKRSSDFCEKIKAWLKGLFVCGCQR